MNEAKMNAMTDEIASMMEKIAKKNGLDFRRGNITWGEHGFVFKKMEFKEKSKDGLDPKAVEEFNFYAYHRHGILDSALNVFFTANNGDKLKIVGYANKNRKDKFLLVDDKGGKFKASVKFIQSNLPAHLQSPETPLIITEGKLFA